MLTSCPYLSCKWPCRDTRGDMGNPERREQSQQIPQEPANLRPQHGHNHHPKGAETEGDLRQCFTLSAPQHPPPKPLGGTNLCSAPLTHRSPVSRMLLRYLWQSWRTWGQKREGCGTVGLARESTCLSALMLEKRRDLVPYTTPALGEVPAFPRHPKVKALHREVSKTQDNRVPHGLGKVAGVGKGTHLLCRGTLARAKSFPLPVQQEGCCRGDTHVGVAVTQDLVQDVAELPAEDGTAGQGQPDGVGPEGECSLLVVCPQDDPFQCSQGQPDTHGAQDRLGWGLFLFNFH